MYKRGWHSNMPTKNSKFGEVN
jgi:hypothetical protein